VSEVCNLHNTGPWRSAPGPRQNSHGVSRMSLTGLLIVVIIGLVLFGSGKLPGLGSGIGKTIANFKRGFSEPEEIDISAKKKDQERGPKS